MVPGSGGKDSVYASYVLKYKYKMNPLTVTWSPNLYTEIGWKNFQSWLHKGRFSNFIHAKSKIHKLITREAKKDFCTVPDFYNRSKNFCFKNNS